MMAKVTYVEANGTVHLVEATIGSSLMNVARDQGVPGILGECGGVLSCATCHVLVKPEWVARVLKAAPSSSYEHDLLDGVPGVETRSRLSCQIKMSEALDGLVVDVPAEQY